MKFEPNLQEGKLLKRYKRFFADVELANGELVVAHVPNTGSLKSCLHPPQKCWVSFTDDPKRKLKYTLQAITSESVHVGVNTALPNGLVFEAFEDQLVDHWKDYDMGQREVKISEKSRIDIVLWKSHLCPLKKLKFGDLKDYPPEAFLLIEIKNVTMATEKIAQFPDSVTTRGQKHVQELTDMKIQGYECEFVFVIQRNDCDRFSPARDIDETYSSLLDTAIKKGVKVSAWPCKLGKTGIEIFPNNSIPYA